MTEALLFAGIVSLIAALGLARALTAPFTLLAAGAAVTALGTALSVLGGAGYHLMLYATLGRRGALARNWVWQPTHYHRRLTPEERERVLPWFVLGASGFGLVVVGGIVVFASSWRDGAG